jgi:hypothetical protein
MKSSYIFFTLIFLFFTSFCNAQLTKGTKTIGYGGGISASISKNSFTNNLQKFNSQNIYQSISAGYFLNEKWLLSGSVGIEINRNMAKTISINSLNPIQKNNNVSFNLGFFARYYVKNTGKNGVFLFSNLYDGFSVNAKKFVDDATSSNVKTTDNSFYWSAGLGWNEMINDQLAYEAVLYYDKNKNISMSAYLQNFIKTFDKNGLEGTLQYIAKNRWLVSGSIGINYNVKIKDFSFGINGLGGKMLTDKIMVGSEFNVGLGKNKSLNLAPFIRYYIPITPRLYVYPYIGSSFRAFEGTDGKSSNISFNRGMGYNYFLTRNLVVSGNIGAGLSHSANSGNKFNNSSLNINAGISYFIN